MSEVIQVMLGIDLSARLKNKAFWVSMASAIALLCQQLGLNIIPGDYSAVINSLLTILAMLGIVVDTSTPGISDQPAANSTNVDKTSDSEEK